uniref:DUF4123 domain-containing protein n=1 Tax=Halomonas sp. TaxID=1486246 RepID=UPI002623FD37|nr:DUF4123 domain-containing protein [Halomonas sp.]
MRQYQAPKYQAPKGQSTVDTLPEDALLVHQYALLNPLSIDAEDWADLPCEPLLTPNVNARPHLLPQLVRLNEMPRDARLALRERIERHRQRGVAFFCALLGSHAPAERVARHLMHHLEQRRQGDSRYWWLRFYDPYVFRHLCWQLDAEQMDVLLGPIHAWTWPDDDGRWHHQRHQSSEAPKVYHLFLSKEQWQRIDRLALLNSTLEMLVLLAPEVEQNAVLWQWVDNLLEQAEQWPLPEDDDRQLYAEQAVRFHPGMHDHPVILSCLKRAREPGMTYTQACADLDDARMMDLAAELDDRDIRKEAP